MRFMHQSIMFKVLADPKAIKNLNEEKVTSTEHMRLKIQTRKGNAGQ